MKNGDHLTCEIKGLNGGVLYVSLPYGIQTLSVDWSQVASVRSKQLFFVTTEDGSVYRGIINSVQTAAGRPIEIEIAETQQRNVILNSARIVEVAETSEKFFRRLTGGVSIGTIYSKGNRSTQYNISGLAVYPQERWAVQVGLSSNLSKATGAATSTRNQLTFGGIHLLPWKDYFYGAYGGFLQSTEQGIRLQSTAAGGIGRYLKNTNRATISVLGGFGWLNTQYNPTVPPIATQNVAAAMINADVKLFTFNRTSFDLNTFVFPALSQPGRVYVSTNATYYVKLIWNLSWNISFYGNWDTRPPGNLPGSDYGTTSGLTWTFGPSLRTTPTTMQTVQ
jgi:hypothetical protein